MGYETLDQDYDAGVETRLSYVICSTPRCGSYLLCELLWRTGLAGAPEEFFNPRYLPGLMERWGVGEMDDYLAALLVHKTSPNGVFGVKMHWAQYGTYLLHRDLTELFPAPRFIHIGRADRLRQAISWSRAMQSLRWKSSDPDLRPATFDRADIRAKLRRIEHSESSWSDLFERQGIEPLEVVYERLAESPGDIVGAVLDHIGIEAPVAVPAAAALRRQSDTVSDEWHERYLAGEPASEPLDR